MQHSIKHPFEEVITQNKDRIFRICKVYAAGPVGPEDLFQEVIIQIWKSFLSFEGKASINTWVYRITLNVCLRYQKRMESRGGQMVQLEAVRFRLTATADDPQHFERHQALYSCIRSLNEQDQCIVIMVLDELPYADIAEVTGLTENHIAVKMKRIRKKLLPCLKSKLQ
mgnify:CR=1 FL=1